MVCGREGVTGRLEIFWQGYHASKDLGAIREFKAIAQAEKSDRDTVLYGTVIYWRVLLYGLHDTKEEPCQK